MCLWNTDPPVATRSKYGKNLIKVLHFDPIRPQGHGMSVKCEQPLDELTVQIWLLYDHQTLTMKMDICEILMPPFPNISRIGLTFDLDLSPTDLNIDRGHVLIKDYLPTKIEAYEAKHSWAISCTKYGRPTWPLTLTSDLRTWISIGIIYSSRTIYLPSLKLLGKSALELSVAQGMGDQHDFWPWPLTYWPEYQ